MISTVDPDTRHAHKSRSSKQDGYKAHIAVEPGTGLITGCELTPGNVDDAVPATDLLASETAPVEVLADSAYGSADTRTALDGAGHSTVIKPVPLQRAVAGRVHHRRLHHHTARAPPPAPPTRPCRSAPRATRPSGLAATAIRCVSIAPPQAVAAP